MTLVLRALGIGDLATAVPALRGLRAAFPDRPLTLAAPGWLAPLVELTGAVDRQLPVTDLTPRRWPGPPPALGVNLHGRGPQSHQLLRCARPAALYAFACPAAGQLAGPPWREEEHEVHRWCQMLNWYGVPADPSDLSLRRPPPGRYLTGMTVIHPGAKAVARRWPVARFAAVARALTAAGHQVVITGSPADRPLASRLARLADLPVATVLAGSTGLAELAATVAHARLVISGDTGIAHLATAYRTPSVLLFGPMPPHRWGPPPHRREHRVLWHGQLAGQPGGSGPHPTLLAISVAEVLAAVAAAHPA